MKIKGKFFGMYRERVGKEEAVVEVEEDTTVAALIQKLTEENPGLRDYASSIIIAVNGEYVEPDFKLSEGDEVAFIPPLSGGVSKKVKEMVEVTENPLSPQPLIERVRKDTHGAVVTFLGIVRGYSEGRKVLFLEYGAYKEMAERKLQQIVDEIRDRWQLEDVAIVHRTGRLKVGETSLIIAIASPHRREAFEACQYTIDRIKEIVPIWKKEVWEGGEGWVGEKAPRIS